MAVSTTTFQERLARIESGTAPNTIAAAGKAKRRAARPKRNPFTFPFFVGLGILTGGTAYAWVATVPEYQWVMALAN